MYTRGSHLVWAHSTTLEDLLLGRIETEQLVITKQKDFGATGSSPCLLLLEKWQVFNKASEWLEGKKKWERAGGAALLLNKQLRQRRSFEFLVGWQCAASCCLVLFPVYFWSVVGLVLAIRTWVVWALSLFLFHLCPFDENREQNGYFCSSFPCYFLLLPRLWTFRSTIMLWKNKVLFRESQEFIDSEHIFSATRGQYVHVRV